MKYKVLNKQLQITEFFVKSDLHIGIKITLYSKWKI